jgi:hypothetical protein
LQRLEALQQTVSILSAQISAGPRIMGPGPVRKPATSLVFDLTPLSEAEGTHTENILETLVQGIPNILRASMMPHGKATRVTLQATGPIDRAAIGTLVAANGWSIQFADGATGEV